MKHPDQRRAWMVQINKLRRKGGADSFTVKKSTKVCEFHFRPEEIKVSIGTGRKTLLPGSVPSNFKFKEKTPVKKRKSPVKRIQVIEESSESEYKDSEYSEIVSNSSFQEETINNEMTDNENDNINNENVTNYCCYEKDQEIKRLTDETRELKTEVEHLRTKVFNFENVSAKPDLFKKFAGLGVQEFTYLYDFLMPGEFCENVKIYESGETPTPASAEGSAPSTGCKRGRRTKLKAIQQLFLFMTWLKCGFTLPFAAWLFDTPKATVSRYIITWANFMYFSLGERNIWPSMQQIQEMMPETFRKAYPSTRCIIDCTILHYFARDHHPSPYKVPYIHRINTMLLIKALLVFPLLEPSLSCPNYTRDQFLTKILGQGLEFYLLNSGVKG